MTESRCWVTFKSDRALQRRIANGWYTQDGTTCLPIESFPPASGGTYWDAILTQWCYRAGVQWKQADGYTRVARVKKEQIEDFIRFVYDDDRSYCDPKHMLTWKGRAYLAHRLTDLRAFVAQELRPRIWYELNADAF